MESNIEGHWEPKILNPETFLHYNEVVEELRKKFARERQGKLDKVIEAVKKALFIIDDGNLPFFIHIKVTIDE